MPTWNKGQHCNLDNPGNSKGLLWLKVALQYEGDECQLWPFGVCQNGYGASYSDGKFAYPHRMVCEKTNGPAPSPKHHAAHSCGHKLCVTKRHVSWKTNSENQLDRREHGTNKKTWNKLTPAQVAEIRSLEGKELTRSLAKRFGVNEVTIRQIFKREIWKTGEITYGGFKPGDPRNPFKRGTSHNKTCLFPSTQGTDK
jgi:hypothetical protein